MTYTQRSSGLMRLLFFPCLLALLAMTMGGDQAWALDVQRTQLDNGLIILTLERSKLPIVSLQLLIRAGSVLDPEAKAGLANLVASLLRRGTKTRSAIQIADEIDFVGGSLNISSDKDFVRASVKVLAKDLDGALDLLSDILVNPTFDPVELERSRREVMASIQASEDDPGDVSRRAFEELVFGFHPYHRPSEGYASTVETLLREDLVLFHDTYYRPNNAILAVVGDIPRDTITSKIEKYMGSWRRRWIDYPFIPAAPQKSKVHQKEIDKKITQANIYLGHLGISRKNPDYYAILVMNRILGEGSVGSRMGVSIRSEQGLAYHVHSRFNAGWFPSSFEVVMQTKNESANRAIESALAEVEKIRESGVTDEELNDAKTYFTSLFPVELETNDKLANLLLECEFYGLGMDYFDRYPVLIDLVAKEDVLRVARQYLNPDNLCLVVVGNAQETKLEKFR